MVRMMVTVLLRRTSSSGILLLDECYCCHNTVVCTFAIAGDTYNWFSAIFAAVAVVVNCDSRFAFDRVGTT